MTYLRNLFFLHGLVENLIWESEKKSEKKESGKKVSEIILYMLMLKKSKLSLMKKRHVPKLILSIYYIFLPLIEKPLKCFYKSKGLYLKFLPTF